jgi:hypothetical protein
MPWLCGGRELERVPLREKSGLRCECQSAHFAGYMQGMEILLTRAVGELSNAKFDVFSHVANLVIALRLLAPNHVVCLRDPKIPASCPEAFQ